MYFYDFHIISDSLNVCLISVAVHSVQFKSLGRQEYVNGTQ